MRTFAGALRLCAWRNLALAVALIAGALSGPAFAQGQANVLDRVLIEGNQRIDCLETQVFFNRGNT